MVTEAQKKATSKYERKTYDKILLRLNKNSELNADAIKQAANRCNESVNGFIKKAIAQRINQEVGE